MYAVKLTPINRELIPDPVKKAIQMILWNVSLSYDLSFDLIAKAIQTTLSMGKDFRNIPIIDWRDENTLYFSDPDKEIFILEVHKVQLWIGLKNGGGK